MVVRGALELQPWLWSVSPWYNVVEEIQPMMVQTTKGPPSLHREPWEPLESHRPPSREVSQWTSPRNETHPWVTARTPPSISTVHNRTPHPQSRALGPHWPTRERLDDNPLPKMYRATHRTCQTGGPLQHNPPWPDGNPPPNPREPPILTNWGNNTPYSHSTMRNASSLPTCTWVKPGPNNNMRWRPCPATHATPPISKTDHRLAQKPLHSPSYERPLN